MIPVTLLIIQDSRPDPRFPTLETSLALEGELTDKGLSALSESSDSMTRELARALVEQISFTGSLKDMWAAYRKKEVQIDCNVFDTKPVNRNVNRKLTPCDNRILTPL